MSRLLTLAGNKYSGKMTLADQCSFLAPGGRGTAAFPLSVILESTGADPRLRQPYGPAKYMQFRNASLSKTRAADISSRHTSAED